MPRGKRGSKNRRLAGQEAGRQEARRRGAADCQREHGIDVDRKLARNAASGEVDEAVEIVGVLKSPRSCRQRLDALWTATRDTTHQPGAVAEPNSAPSMIGKLLIVQLQ